MYILEIYLESIQNLSPSEKMLSICLAIQCPNKRLACLQFSKTLTNKHDVVQRIDREMDKIVDFQKNQINWSEKILALASITPSDIMIKQFRISKEDLTFNITGLAKDRDSFLVFKKDLEDLNFFPKVISPLSNITSKENLNFNLSGHIKKENEK